MSSTTDTTRPTAIVVGGSLAGLMTALTLSRAGTRVTILERNGPVRGRGGGLLISDGLVERVTGWGRTPGSPPVPTSLTGGFHSWHKIFTALFDAVDADPGATLVHNARVVSVGQDDDGAWAVTDDDRTFRADMVIGADGHRSIVRAAVAPEHPDASFAGYVIWLSGVDERDLPDAVRGDRAFEGLAFLRDRVGLVLGGAFPGEDGSTAPGRRSIGWGWYDRTHNDFLVQGGFVRGSSVHHSVTAADIPDELRAELVATIQARWPSPWKEAMLASIRTGTIIGTPISEYVPDQLVDGRLAIVGDAAHVSTPMTGAGFTEALADAETLAAAITADTRSTGRRDVLHALRVYEKKRLSGARRTVQSGKSFSDSFRPAA